MSNIVDKSKLYRVRYSTDIIVIANNEQEARDRMAAFFAHHGMDNQVIEELKECGEIVMTDPDIPDLRLV